MVENYLHFITNRGKTLYQTISNLSSNVENIYILVGFFYFSGFFRLKDEFKNKNIKILIGLDIQKHLSNLLIEYEIFKAQPINESISDIKNRFYSSIVKAFSQSDIFDNYEVKESLEIFVKKIEDGTIEVRKTKEPNHAKLYIFENKPEFSQNGDYPGTVITGSSNLSIEGLEKRFEIDIISREKSHYLEAKRIFDSLWNSSIPVVNKENISEFREKVLKKIWPTYDIPTPFEVYVRVLIEYFSVSNKTHIRIPKEINKQSMNLAYQNDAVKFGIDAIKRHNGVIIADVVGLGKSIVASAIAHNLNLDTIVICPPHLEEQWNYYKRSYKFMGDVYSSGKIEKALKDWAGTEGKKLIIVDEAHRFRNTDTVAYKQLWLLCQGNYVLLLTATPFNNTPQDIESLLKLFDSPKKSTLKHIDDLSREFKELIKKYKYLKKTSKNLKREQIKERADEIAKRIRYIISPITLRRTRVDLQKIKKYKDDLERQGIEFPKVNPPEIVSYSFNELDELYLETIEKFVIDEDNLSCEGCFKASRYKTISYITDDSYKGEIAVKYSGISNKKEAINFIEESQKSLSTLIRRIFVKRFESSFGSFKNSVDKYIASHEKIREYYLKEGKIPIYKKIDQLPSVSEIEEMTPDEREEILSKFDELERKDELIWVDASKLSNKFIEDLEKDIDILKDIKNKWSKYVSNPEIYDYKLKKLFNILYEKLEKKEKIIIFSEYSDTVDYLFEQLKANGFRVIRYDASSKESVRDEIERNFDASYQEHLQKDDYDILITTDVLSEGINLHRANNIINYDIPYNPTKVIQRIGRVNRISKNKLKDIWIYNFFPTKIGEGHTNIRNISTLKMYMIHFLLGEDTQYLTNDEELRSFFYEEFKRSQYFEEESWDVEYRNFLYDVEENHPDIYQRALSIPYRTKIKRILDKEIKIENTKLESPLYIVFSKKGENFIFKLGFYKDGKFNIRNINDEDAIKIFQATLEEKSFEVDKKFYDTYNEIKKTIFSSQNLVMTDRWDREIYGKIENLKKDAQKNFPQYVEYLNKLKKLFDLEVIPDYIAGIVKNMKFESKEDLENLIKELPEFYVDEVIKRIDEYDKEDDIIIISEEITTTQN